MTKAIGLEATQWALLKALVQTNHPLSSSYLANSLGLSSKTIRTYLMDLDHALIHYGATIQSRSGSGFWLRIDDTKAFQPLSDHLERFTTVDSFYEDIEQSRANLIIRELISANDYVRSEDFQPLMYINATSVKQAISRAKLILSKYDLGIVSKSRHGIKIVGNEHDIRSMIIFQRYAYSQCHLVLPRPETYGDYLDIDPTIMDQIKRCLIDHQATFTNLHLSQWAIDAISASIVVWAKRNAQGHYVHYDATTRQWFTNRNCYYVAKMVLDHCQHWFDHPFTHHDVVALSILLVAWRVNINSEDIASENKLRNKDIALEVIQYLHSINHFHYLNKDLSLLDTLACAMEPYLTRSQYHLFTNRFLANGDDTVSLMARKMAFQALVYLHQHYDGDVNGEEILYFSHLIRPYFGRYPHMRRKIDACVVSSIDQLISASIKERLSRNFDGFFESIDIMDLYELKASQNHYSIVFTDYPFSKLDFLDSKTLLVHTTTFFDETYKQNLHAILTTRCALGETTFASYLPKDHILLDVNAKNENDVILHFGHFLFHDDHDRFTKFIDELTYMENVFETRPRNNVVIMTGIHSHCQQTTIIVMVLKRSILWGNGGGKAQVIVYWDSGNSDQDAPRFENEFIPHEIDEVFHNKDVVDELIDDYSYDNLIFYLDEYRNRIISTGAAFR